MNRDILEVAPREYVQRVAGEGLQLAAVVSASAVERVCAVRLLEESDEVVLEGVRLSASLEAAEALCVPKVGSVVLVGRLSLEGVYAVLMVSELEQVLYLGGDNGGLVRVQPLVARLNTLEQKLNEVIAAVRTHTHAPVPPNGTAPPSAGLAGLAGVDSTRRGDLENEKFKH